MMKGRTCQHETINQSHRDAYIEALRESAQHAAGLRAVDIQLVSDTRVSRGNDEGPAVHRKADMTDEAFVQDLIDEIPIIDSALGKSPERRAFGWSKSFHSCRD